MKRILISLIVITIFNSCNNNVTTTEYESDKALPDSSNEELTESSIDDDNDLQYIEDNTKVEIDGLIYTIYKGSCWLTGVDIKNKKTNIIIPDSITVFKENYAVQEIISGAFKNSNVRSITIPKTIWDLSYDVFDNIPTLEAIYVSPNSPYYSSYDGAIYTKDFTKLIKCPEGKTSIQLAENITRLFENDLSNCNKLIKLKLPSSFMNNFNWYCWFSNSNCLHSIANLKNLENIEVSDNNKQIASFNGLLYSKKLDTLILAPRAIKICDLYSNLKVIGNGALSDCKHLKFISLPNSIISIGNNAFHSCSNLEEVKLPNKLKEIGFMAFAYCHKLKDINIPPLVESIERNAFQRNRIKKINIPRNTRVENMFVFQCDSLERIEVDIDNPYYESLAGVLFTKGLDTLLNYPSGKKNIDYNIPLSTKALNEFALSYTNFLEAINLHENLTSIGIHCFSGSKKLKRVKLPSLIEVVDGVFSQCPNLESVSLGKNVKKIEAFTFQHSYQLKSIYIYTEKPPKVFPSTFRDVSEHLIIYVPSQSIEEYRNTKIWDELRVEQMVYSCSIFNDEILFQTSYFPFDFYSYNTDNLLTFFSDGVSVDSTEIIDNGYVSKIYTFFDSKSRLSFFVKPDNDNKESKTYFYIHNSLIESNFFKSKNGVKIGMTRDLFYKTINIAPNNCDVFFIEEGDWSVYYKFYFDNDKLKKIDIEVSQ